MVNEQKQIKQVGGSVKEAVERANSPWGEFYHLKYNTGSLVRLQGWQEGVQDCSFVRTGKTPMTSKDETCLTFCPLRVEGGKN